MISRAMKITGLYKDLSESETNKILSSCKDSTDISGFAQESSAACLKAEVIFGTGSGKISPKDNISRAEVAVIVQRMLKRSGLI
jgi:hypothetical protein